MTAALGRLPTIQAGAWVWDDVRPGRHPALQLKPGTLASCAAAAEKKYGESVANSRWRPVWAWAPSARAEAR